MRSRVDWGGGGGYTFDTDCLPNAGPTASPCGPMLYLGTFNRPLASA